MIPSTKKIVLVIFSNLHISKCRKTILLLRYIFKYLVHFLHEIKEASILTIHTLTVIKDVLHVEDFSAARSLMTSKITGEMVNLNVVMS